MATIEEKFTQNWRSLAVHVNDCLVHCGCDRCTDDENGWCPCPLGKPRQGPTDKRIIPHVVSKDECLLIKWLTGMYSLPSIEVMYWYLEQAACNWNISFVEWLELV